MRQRMLNDFRVLLSVALAALGTSAMAWADIGPKPSMDFQFVYQDLPGLHIQSGTLLECADPACVNAEALREVGPQRFTCNLDSCSSVAYSYQDYYKLAITFSDGVTRESNVFGTDHYGGFYRVTVSEGGLLVTEVGGGANLLSALSFIGAAAALLFVGSMLGLVTVLAALSVGARKRPLSLESRRGWLVVGWALAVPVVVLTSLASPAVAVTVVLELGLGFLYATLRRKPRFTLVTTLLLVNALTSPLLGIAWSILRYVTVGTPGLWQGFAELVVWLVEAAAIYFTHRSAFSFREALALAFGLNATSWLVGLVLPL
ncbi:MAG TPA: hypothetical protein VI520_05545 [Anaerolineales bacterium]|nr:hypothetical protein [Anaerolineales bacterium]